MSDDYNLLVSSDGETLVVSLVGQATERAARQAREIGAAADRFGIPVRFQLSRVHRRNLPAATGAESR